MEMMSELHRSNGNVDPKVFFLRATLAQPVRPDGGRGHFSQDCIRALSLARPLSARNWAVKIEAAAGCVIRTSIEARSERHARQQVVAAIEAQVGRLNERPSHVDVKSLAEAH